MPRPPHDPYTLILDGRVGWRALDAPTAVIGPPAVGAVADASGAGGLGLLPLPDSGRTLAESSGSFGGLILPRHLALAVDGRAAALVLLDARNGRLRRFDPCACAFVDLPCLAPGDPRLPGGATAIAAVWGRLYLADPAGRQVRVLDEATGAARGLWRAPLYGPLGDPNGPIADWQPAAIAAVTPGAQGTAPATGVWVGDRLNGLLLRFSPAGRLLERHPGFGAILALAADDLGRLLVLSEGAGPGGGEVAHYDPSRRVRLAPPQRPESMAAGFPPLPLTVRADGAVDLAPLCVPPASAPRVFDAAGERVPDPAPDPGPRHPLTGTWYSADLDSGIAECVWDRIQVRARVPAHTRLAIDTLTAETELDPESLRDSPEWRPALVLVGGAEGTGAPSDPDFMLRAAPGRRLWLRLTLTGDGASTPVVERIAIDYPRVSLTRYLPAVFVREPVAAELTGRFLAILDRSYRAIEMQIDAQARLFDPRSAPAEGNRDFLSFLAGWVGLTGIGALPLARRRELIREAPRAYAWRGTPYGLTRTLYLLLGLAPWARHRSEPAPCVPCPLSIPERFRWRPPRLILEHFVLRRWLWLGSGRLSDNARLWGERIVNRSRLGAGATSAAAGSAGCPHPGLPLAVAGCTGPADARQSDPGGLDETARLGVTQLKTVQDPWRDPFHVYAHRLSVFVPAGCLGSPGMGRALERILAAEIPGHAKADLIPVEPRFRVGVQAMLGLDAVIGYRAARPELDAAALGRGTVLGPGPAGTAGSGAGDGGGRSLRVGTRRIGMDTTLQ